MQRGLQLVQALRQAFGRGMLEQLDALLALFVLAGASQQERGHVRRERHHCR